MRILPCMKRYEPKQFPRLKGLSGISDALLQDHFDWRACEARLIK